MCTDSSYNLIYVNLKGTNAFKSYLLGSYWLKICVQGKILKRRQPTTEEDIKKWEKALKQQMKSIEFPQAPVNNLLIIYS